MTTTTNITELAHILPDTNGARILTTRTRCAGCYTVTHVNDVRNRRNHRKDCAARDRDPAAARIPMQPGPRSIAGRLIAGGARR